MTSDIHVLFRKKRRRSSSINISVCPVLCFMTKIPTRFLKKKKKKRLNTLDCNVISVYLKIYSVVRKQNTHKKKNSKMPLCSTYHTHTHKKNLHFFFAKQPSFFVHFQSATQVCGPQFKLQYHHNTPLHFWQVTSHIHRTSCKTQYKKQCKEFNGNPGRTNLHQASYSTLYSQNVKTTNR